jgi:hypothetical protein
MYSIPYFFLQNAPGYLGVLEYQKATMDRERRGFVFKNIPHEEVFRGCTIFGIFFDSCLEEGETSKST